MAELLPLLSAGGGPLPAFPELTALSSAEADEETATHPVKTETSA